MGKKGAMVLAAGKGTRMYPLTLTMPKVLLPVAGMPMLSWTLAWLKNHGIAEVAINLHHCGDKIRKFLGDGSLFGMTVYYSWERQLLGTALGAKNMSQYCGDTQVIIYGDVLTDLDLSAMIEFHTRRQAEVTIALFNKRDRDDVGIVHMESDGRLRSFIEKPSVDGAGFQYANGGIYVVNRSIFDVVPDTYASDFGHDVLPRLIRNGAPVYGYILREEEYLLDIGTFERYGKANTDALGGRINIDPFSITRETSKPPYTGIDGWHRGITIPGPEGFSHR